MSAFKSKFRELSIEYFNMPEIGGVREISSKEREGPSSLRLKADGGRGSILTASPFSYSSSIGVRAVDYIQRPQYELLLYIITWYVVRVVSESYENYEMLGFT